jgi:diadenosine tetraphosphate (Ap4A) HIT family hydrolase
MPCPFCSLDSGPQVDRKRARDCLPRRLSRDGHTLVIPRQHVASLYELTADEQSAIWSLVAEVRKRLLTGLKPDGFNIGVNDGLAAGQTVEHAHVHVIPRHK